MKFMYLMLFGFLAFFPLDKGFALADIFEAASSGDQETLKSLVEKEKVPVDLTNSLKQTPLIIAIQNKKITAVQYLIQHGANINFKIKNSGYTPLFFAVLAEDTNIIGYLLDNGANWKALDAVDPSGFTPMHYAVKSGKLDVVKIMVEKGVDINIQDRANKGTPIDWACDYGYPDLVTYLADKGADINTPDRWKDTALDWNWLSSNALTNPKIKAEIEQILLKKGGKYNHLKERNPNMKI